MEAQAVQVAVVVVVPVPGVTALVQVVARLIAVEIRSNRTREGKVNHSNRRVIWAFLLLVGVGLFFLLKFFIFAKPDSPYTRLETNTHFVEAQVAFNNGAWSEAIGLYKQALTETSDPDEKLAIQYYLAAAENSNGQHLEAVPLLKRVAAAPTLSNEIRAYALQFMGIMTLNLTDPTAHAAIMAEIFKDSPYKDMYVANDDSLSTRHLFEYASSLYPLGISEAHIARWHAENIVRNNLSTTTEPGLSDLVLINKRLTNADRDIERTKDIKQSSNLIPQIYARKAETTEGLYLAGVVSKEQALEAYRKALDSYPVYSTLAGDDWFLRFRYASFLANAYGPSREKDIHTVVAPLYGNVDYLFFTKLFFTTLGKERLTKDPTTSLENNALKAWGVGKIDADFKDFLISLGWKK